MMKRIEIKKKFFLCATFFISFPSGGLELVDNSGELLRTCGIVSSEYYLMEGELSDTWAQELIGADLLKLELEELPLPSHTNFISIFDTGDTHSHAHKVRHLISGPGTYATLPELEDKISIFKTRSTAQSEYHFVASQLKETGQIPSFINNSMSWFEKSEIYESFNSLSPPALVVTASGNNFPDFLDRQKSHASHDFDAIVVGSFSPFGFVSNFSQEGEEVWILAPSDEYITSVDFNGEYRRFGGTSGATPFVTGALAGFEWISGYHPKGGEAKILLEKTAIPTLHSYERPKLNGVGLLNTYKLGRVAQRLKTKCQKDTTGNEAGDGDCFQEEIRNEENYHFLRDKTLEADLSKAFPYCYGIEDSDRVVYNKTSCEEKASVFKRLRAEVLLSPKQKNLWKPLSCIYQAAGFLQNALMVDRIALSLLWGKSF